MLEFFRNALEARQEKVTHREPCPFSGVEDEVDVLD